MHHWSVWAEVCRVLCRLIFIYQYQFIYFLAKIYNRDISISLSIFWPEFTIQTLVSVYLFPGQNLQYIHSYQFIFFLARNYNRDTSISLSISWPEFTIQTLVSVYLFPGQNLQYRHYRPGVCSFVGCLCFCLSGNSVASQWQFRLVSHQKVSGEFSSPGSAFCADSYCVSVPPPISVTAVARKRTRPFCQICRWQVTAKRTYSLLMWLHMKWHYKLVHGCPVYTERAPRRQQFHVAPAMWQPNSAESTPLRWTFRSPCSKRAVSLVANRE